MNPLFRKITIAFACVVVVSSGFAQQITDGPAALRKAKEFFINGTTLQIQGNRHAEAILEFQQSLRYDSSAATLTAMARSYRELRKFDVAREVVEQALKIDKRSRDAWELLAEIEVLQGRYDEGIAAYEHILELNPTRRQLYTLARLYEPRNAKRAIELYEQIIAKSPDVTMYLRLSELYQRTKDTKNQIRVLDRAAQLEPDDPQIAAERTELYVSQAMFPELRTLLATWNGLLQEQARSVDVWMVALSRVLEDSLVMGLYSSRVSEVLDDAATTMQKSWPVMAISGSISIAMNDTAKAGWFFGQMIDNPQMIPEGFLEIGRVYAVNSLPERAMEFLRIGRTRFAEDIRFPLVMSSVLLDMGQDADAIALLEQASRLDDSVSDVWVQLGMLYDRKKRLQESDEAYEKALRIDSMNALANNNYAYSLSLRQLDLDRARSMSLRAITTDNTNAAYLDTYAWILFQLGRFDEARDFIEKAIDHGGNATHYEHYGAILRAQGNRDEAVTAYEKALELDPQRTSAREALKDLTK